MKPISLLALALVATTASPLLAADLTVYDDALVGGFADWSWATCDLQHTLVVHGGEHAIAFEPDAWQALFLHRDLGISAATYEAIELWVHGGAAGGQNVAVALTAGGDPIGTPATLASFLAGGVIPANSWVQATIPFADLGVTSGSFDGFWLQDDTGGNQATLFVDDVALVENDEPPPPPGPVAVAVAPTLDRHPISPLIYGVNFAPTERIGPVGYTVNRWGGNSTTRYNWQVDVHNTASDWFFMNVPNDNANPAALPHGSDSDEHIDATRAAGAVPLITVPTIGWTPTPVDRAKRWGFSEATYGAQTNDECRQEGFPDWCTDDAGNGILSATGQPVAGNDAADTSVEVGPDFVTDWMSHIASRVGSASGGGVRFYALDNEPMLWHETHRDVHPTPLGFDELWGRTVAYASAMKTLDPAVEIFGPDTWGPCDLFYTAADECAPGADHAAHGDFIPAYLDAVCDYRDAHGVLLVDWLDIHFYPQGDGVAATTGDQRIEDSEAVIARRLRSLRELWDPAWQSESWVSDITGPVQLIPKLRAWRDAECADLKIALTEYKWGRDDTPSGALAQAEALAIFGRERLDLATRWTAPESGDWVEDAFALFRNYDGGGGRVEGDSVRATSSDLDAVTSYAVRGDGNMLYVLLFNHDVVEREANVSVAGGLWGSAVQLWRFDATHRLGAAGTLATSAGAFTAPLPPRSATLARVPLSSAIYADGLEPGDAWHP